MTTYRPISRLKVARMRFFKCDHTQEVVMAHVEDDLDAGDLVVCKKCNVLRLVMEASNRIEKANYVIPNNSNNNNTD